MRKVLLIKSRRTLNPERGEGDELSTEEKLTAALKERVEKAENERDRNRALRELKEFTSAAET
jgi:hypothetical protein